jgi:hypothetical protein
VNWRYFLRHPIRAVYLAWSERAAARRWAQLRRIMPGQVARYSAIPQHACTVQRVLCETEPKRELEVMRVVPGQALLAGERFELELRNPGPDAVEASIGALCTTADGLRVAMLLTRELS